MEEREFNLLDEPWVCAISPGCAMREVSLTDALLQAHMFADLSGEMAAQDIAVLRLMLAVLHAVFSRVDAEGREAPLKTPDDALQRWKSLRDLGRFPEGPIRAYLEKWHERFYLFHPERPFYQVVVAASGSEYQASKLNGELSESNHKLKLFSLRAGSFKEELTYPEAARWLLYLNAFDDNSLKSEQSKSHAPGRPYNVEAKISDEEKSSAPGAGWLGKLGLIQAVGSNLFETLLLNLTLLFDGSTLWEEKECPIWELENAREAERTEISLPRNCAGLLTLQSRRILLKRAPDRVTGYTVLGGDFFPKENAFAEQMTLWRESEDKQTKQIALVPWRHDKSRQIWREFAAIAAEKESQRAPGLVKWLERLQKQKLLEKNRMIHLRTVAVQYGSSDYMAEDSFSDSLSLHSNLLSEAGRGWQKRIEEQLQKIDETAKAYSYFTIDLAKASGRSENDFKALQSAAKKRWYGRVDLSFRAWLAGVDAEQDNDEIDDLQLQWQNQARRLAMDLADADVLEAGDAAFVGRTLEEKKKTAHYSAPEAYRYFRNAVYKIYPHA